MNIYQTSLQGIRKQNEDKHLVLDFNGNRAICLFDGHGGKEVSTFLSDHFKKNIDKFKLPLQKSDVHNIFKNTQKDINNKISPSIGSTSLMVFDYVNNNNRYLDILNLGDSRCVLCRNSLAIPLTNDHKPIFPDEKNRINQLGGKIEYDGFDWRVGDLSVSRSFGDSDSKPYVSHIPEIFRYKLTNKDRFIIIACDGLWDVLQNHDAVNFVILLCYDDKYKRINQNVNVSKKLAEYAISKGSTDNVSVIVNFL